MRKQSKVFAIVCLSLASVGTFSAGTGFALREYGKAMNTAAIPNMGHADACGYTCQKEIRRCKRKRDPIKCLIETIDIYRPLQ